MELDVAADGAYLVAKAGVATADAVFVAGAHAETHLAVEPRCAALAIASCICACACPCPCARCFRCYWVWGCARRVIVKVKVDGGGTADVGVAAKGVFFDGFGRVEREERERHAGGPLCALHLQD